MKKKDFLRAREINKLLEHQNRLSRIGLHDVSEIVALKYELDVLKERFERFAFLNLDGDVELVRLLELFYLHGWTYLEIREYMYGNKKCESYARKQISNFMKSLE